MGMKIAVMGAGAVGSYLGGKIARANMDVILIGRGEHLKAIRSEGLQVKDDKETFSVQPKAAGSTSNIGTVDLIIFLVKSYDTEDAARQCMKITGEKTSVLSIQNGLDNEEKIGKIMGKGRVIPGLVMGGYRIESPGSVVCDTRTRRVEFGEDGGGITERVGKIRKIFEKSGIEAVVPEDILRNMWKKFMWNVAYNQVCAAERKTCGEVVDDPRTKGMIRSAAEEVMSVGKAKGINLNIRDVEEVVNLHPSFRNFRPSMLQDAERGKRLETETFSGAVIRMGREEGIKTPVNGILYSSLKTLE